MKTLIIVTHPEIEKSVINKRWIEELEKYPEKYTVHQLYKAYPDGKIDVTKEQKLMESYDKIVFQFPFYGSAVRRFSNNGWMKWFYMVGLTEATAVISWQERK
jgi:putative NADPH-quinone reductase